MRSAPAENELLHVPATMKEVQLEVESIMAGEHYKDCPFPLTCAGECGVEERVHTLSQARTRPSSRHLIRMI